ncbi:hypothetical protein FKP32DRAFT_1469148 [Trametes sanguinea]|nr:hypothetical protein FKP32DRAFT_1469148 [Trametes sanguinea]
MGAVAPPLPASRPAMRLLATHPCPLLHVGHPGRSIHIAHAQNNRCMCSITHEARSHLAQAPCRLTRRTSSAHPRRTTCSGQMKRVVADRLVSSSSAGTATEASAVASTENPHRRAAAMGEEVHRSARIQSVSTRASCLGRRHLLLGLFLPF